jgi:hypothetical protein
MTEHFTHILDIVLVRCIGLVQGVCVSALCCALKT